jgi:hypothetical protein
MRLIVTLSQGQKVINLAGVPFLNKNVCLPQHQRSVYHVSKWHNRESVCDVNHSCPECGEEQIGGASLGKDDPQSANIHASIAVGAIQNDGSS